MKTRTFAYIIGIALAAGCTETTSPIVDDESELHRLVNSARADWPKGFSPYGVHARRGRRRLCTRGPHRQFDFWLGHYDLVNPDGSAVGTDAIEREVGGCLITEEFAGTGGIRGRSLNAYDRPTGQWLQTFISELATNFRLNGGIVGDQMVMTGPRLFPLPDGSFFPFVERITWTPLMGDVVNQLFEASFDGGETYPLTTADINYNPADPFEPAPPVGTTSCNAEAYDQLDFWLGHWTVRVGRHVLGRSTIVKDLSGCLIEERFRSRRGYSTRSFVSYDFTTETWHRTYTDNRGNAFRLEGTFSGDRVSMSGTRPGRHGTDVHLTNGLRQVDGRVLQEWTAATEPGDTGATLRLWYVRH